MDTTFQWDRNKLTRTHTHTQNHPQMTEGMPDDQGIHPWNFTWNTTTWHCLKLKKFFAQKLHDLLLLMLLYQLLLLLVVAAVPLLHLLHFHNVPCFISSAKVIVPLDSRIELSRSGGWVRRFAERISWAPWWHWGQSNDEESDALLLWLKVGFYMRWYILLVVVTSRFALTCWCFYFRWSEGTLH